MPFSASLCSETWVGVKDLDILVGFARVSSFYVGRIYRLSSRSVVLRGEGDVVSSGVVWWG